MPEVVYSEKTLDLCWLSTPNIFATLSQETRPIMNVIKVFEVNVSKPECRMIFQTPAKEIKQIFGGPLILSCQDKKCKLLNIEKGEFFSEISIPCGVCEANWIGSQKLFLLYKNNQICCYDYRDTNLDLLYTFKAQCSLPEQLGSLQAVRLQSLSADGMYIYYSDEEIWFAIPELKQSFCVAARGRSLTERCTLLNSILIPENSMAYRRFWHCGVSALPAGCLQIVQVYQNNIVLAIEDGTIQIVKLRHSLVKFCRLFYSGQPCTKQLFKMDEECLALAWKYLLNQPKHSLPESFYKSVSRLSFEHQAILGLISFDQAVENIKKHFLPIHVLTKLCFDFNKKGDNKKVIALLRCLIENEQKDLAYKLIDYVKDHDSKAHILKDCEVYGEALMFAKSARNESLQEELQEIIKNSNGCYFVLPSQ